MTSAGFDTDKFAMAQGPIREFQIFPGLRIFCAECRTALTYQRADHPIRSTSLLEAWTIGKLSIRRTAPELRAGQVGFTDRWPARIPARTKVAISVLNRNP